MDFDLDIDHLEDFEYQFNIDNELDEINKSNKLIRHSIFVCISLFVLTIVLGIIFLFILKKLIV